MFQGHSEHSIEYVFATLDAFFQRPEVITFMEAKLEKIKKKRQQECHEKATRFVETARYIEELNFRQKMTPYWFVTINPKSEIPYEVFHEKIQEIFKPLIETNVIDEFTMAYEIRGTTGGNQGLHAHIIFHKHNIDPNFAQRRIKKHLVPEICGTKKHIVIKWIDEEDVPQVIDYLQKTTVAKSKQRATNATLKWREEMNIPIKISGDALLV